MRIADLEKTSMATLLAWLRRPVAETLQRRRRVAAIIDRVRSQGDTALRALTVQYDGVHRTPLSYRRAEIRRAANRVSPAVRRALAHAACNIERFHAACYRVREAVVTVEPGVQVWREFRAIDRIGMYIPGGAAAYPSTVLMCGIPARIAGCTTLVAATPPSRDGLNPAVALACEMVECDHVYAIGGAQAIAALAYGTTSIDPVDKIVGPGNAWVAEAKRQVFGTVAIDMPAGPSEIMVIADATARASFLAADLLSQLEHAPDAQAVLLATSRALRDATRRAVMRQASALSRRAILRRSMAISALVYAPRMSLLIELANRYAPEHLEIVTQHPRRICAQIRHAGSVFLGPYSSEPLGDYATGANHTLPTNGAARAFGPLGVDSFGTWMQVQSVSRRGCARLATTVQTLAMAEGFDGHAQAVRMREDR